MTYYKIGLPRLSITDAGREYLRRKNNTTDVIQLNFDPRTNSGNKKKGEVAR